MRSSFRIATVAGINLNLHVTFGLVVVMGAWPWLAWGARGALFGGGLSLALFACIALHELGHSLVAKAYGIPVTDITLTPIGGVAMLGDRPRTPTQELLIAIAGPAVNVVLALGFWGLGLLVEGEEVMAHAGATLTREAPRAPHIWVMLISGNAALALFNLIPALPMDGGRVLRAVLSYGLSAETATRVAAAVAQVTAVGLLVVGLSTENPMMPFIAVVVFFGASAEVREARFHRVLSQIRSGDVVTLYAPRFELDTTLGQAVQTLMVSALPVFAVEQRGAFVGVVTREGILQAANARGGWGFLAPAVIRAVPVVEPAETLDVVRSAMQRATVRAAAVVRSGEFLGLVTELELAQALEVTERLERREPRPEPRRSS